MKLLSSLVLLLCFMTPAFALPTFKIEAPTQHNEDTDILCTVKLSQTWNVGIAVSIEIDHLSTDDNDFENPQTTPQTVFIPAGQTIGYFNVRVVDNDGVECQESYRIKGTSTGTHNSTATRGVKLGPIIGDANLDGVFNSTDLVLVWQAGEYEDTIPGNSTWAEGDWNGDGDFNTSDIIKAFQCGSYVNGAAAMEADWEEISGQ